MHVSCVKRFSTSDVRAGAELFTIDRDFSFCVDFGAVTNLVDWCIDTFCHARRFLRMVLEALLRLSHSGNCFCDHNRYVNRSVARIMGSRREYGWHVFVGVYNLPHLKNCLILRIAYLEQLFCKEPDFAATRFDLCDTVLIPRVN